MAISFALCQLGADRHPERRQARCHRCSSRLLRQLATLSWCPGSVSVEQCIHGEKSNVAFLVPGGLGLPEREDCLGADPGTRALRERQRECIGKMLQLASLDRAVERAGAVMALETGGSARALSGSRWLAPSERSALASVAR